MTKPLLLRAALGALVLSSAACTGSHGGWATSTSSSAPGATAAPPPRSGPPPAAPGPSMSTNWDEPLRDPKSASAQPWASRTPFPTEATETVLENQGGIVYAFGGDAGSHLLADVFAYDPTSDAWTPVATLATARAGAAAARLGTKIYVIGGHDGTRALASVEVFDAATGAVSSVASLGTPRNHAAAAIQDGKIYVFGGTPQPTGSIATALSSAEVFDPASGAWSPIASMPEALWGIMGTSAEGLVFLAGGHDASASGRAARATLTTYDPRANVYTRRASAKARRHGGVALPYDGAIYLVGGTYTLLDWQAEPDTGAPRADAQYETSLVERYDIATDSWTTRLTMLTARTFLGGTMANGFAYLAGGHALDLEHGIGDAPKGSGGEANPANGPVPQGTRTFTRAFERFDPLTKTGTSAPLPSNGSGGTLVPGEHDLLLTSSGLTRQYRLSVPQGFTNAQPRPLVLMVHGTSDHMADMDIPGFEVLADRDQVLIAKPQGLVTTGPSHPPIFAYPYPNPIFSLWPFLGVIAPVPGETHVPEYPRYLIGRPATTWEMHDWDPTVNVDFQLMRDVVAAVSSQYDVDQRRIYQFGQSNGALFTSTVGTHHGELYAACVSIAGGDIVNAFANSPQSFHGITGWPRGLGPQGPSPDVVAQSGGRRTPFLFIHGTADTVVPPDGSRWLRNAMIGNGWDENDAQLHLLPNGAHVWWTLHEEIWSFFLAHSL